MSSTLKKLLPFVHQIPLPAVHIPSNYQPNAPQNLSKALRRAKAVREYGDVPIPITVVPQASDYWISDGLTWYLAAHIVGLHQLSAYVIPAHPDIPIGRNPMSIMRQILPHRKTCTYCGKQLIYNQQYLTDYHLSLAQWQRHHQPTLDHIIPESRGGPTVPENLVWTCRDCNSIKNNTYPWFPPKSLFTRAQQFNRDLNKVQSLLTKTYRNSLPKDCEEY